MNRRGKAIRATLTGLLVAMSAVPLFAEDGPIYLGVIEPRLTDSSDPEEFRVRVAFRYIKGSWKAMPHDADDEEALGKLPALYPTRISWAIALDGRRIGEATSVQRPFSTYAHVGIQELTRDSKPPAIQEGAESFATWMGVSAFRPLIAVSRPNYSDPDRWKPFQPSPEVAREARAAFRREVPILRCEEQDVAYDDEDIRILHKAYRSMRGDVLVALRAVPANDRCETAEDAWDSVWFLVSRDRYHFVGIGLTLLDAGDYDADGTSEIMFQTSGYNRDGYLLFHVRTKSKVEFAWTYH